MRALEDRLAAAIEAAGMSKGAVASAVGQSPSAVSNWLSGSRAPGQEHLSKLAEALGVPRRWLAEGSGPVPAAVRELEAQRLTHVAWAARPIPEDGARTGGNAALFAISPSLEVVLREAVQNSLDVGLPGGPVTVDVRLLGLTGDARARFLEALRWPTLRSHLKASIESAADQQIATALEEGLELDAGGELLVLLIADYNTSGLTGPETGEGNFAALTRDTLFSNKGGSTTAGGSHGVGSFTAVRASAVNTVVYLSDLVTAEEEGRRGRLFARSELTWHRNPEGGRDCDGPMWLGATDGPGSVKATSHWAGESDLLVEDLRMARCRGDSPGTTLAIVGLRDLASDKRRTPTEMVEALRDEAARSFFGAIEQGALQVNVDYLQLDAVADGHEPPPATSAAVRPHQLTVSAAVTEALSRHRRDEVVDELIDDEDVVRLRVPLTVPARRDGNHGEFDHEAVVLVRRAPATELEEPAGAEALGHAVLLRGPRMKIKRLDATRHILGARPFQAVVLAGEAAGGSQEDTWAEAFLRLAEPPAHDDWRLTESVRQVYKTGAGRRLKDFEQAIRRAIRDVVVHEVDPPSDGPRDLSRRFRFGAPPERPERAPRLRVDERTVLTDGAWEIRATIRVRADGSRDVRGKPRLVFPGESGRRSTAGWRELTPLSNCEIDPATGVLTIPAGKRSARFAAVSDPETHPVDTGDAAVAVAFRTLEHD